jgi:hypothetical protein
MIDTLRYPVGKFVPLPSPTPAQRTEWIDEIARTPDLVAALVRDLSPDQLARSYRPGGWTVAQVVHHMADSHLNAYARCRWALTETTFTVKPYQQEAWAALPDARDPDVSPSLSMLRGIHTRWVTLLRSLTPEQFTRPFTHPEMGEISIDTLIQLYSWHGRHHGAHIKGAVGADRPV